jgi:hypothetical protein
VVVRNKTVHTNTQVGSQTAFLGIELFEQVALEDFDKKSLREISRILRGPVPTQANVFVDGPPVRGTERLKRPFPFLGINTANRFNHRSPSRREAITTELELFFTHVIGPSAFGEYFQRSLCRMVETDKQRFPEVIFAEPLSLGLLTE